LPKPLPLARFAAADDLRAAIGLWTAWLAGERRVSAHTIAAYGCDLALFLDFLTEHLGELPSLAAMSALQPADFRAYLAHRAHDHERQTKLPSKIQTHRSLIQSPGKRVSETVATRYKSRPILSSHQERIRHNENTTRMVVVDAFSLLMVKLPGA